MSVLQQTVSLAAQLRAFSSLLSLPSQAQSVIKALRRQGIGFADEFNTARFLLSRLESLSAAPTSLSFLRFRSKSSKSSKGGQGETVSSTSFQPQTRLTLASALLPLWFLVTVIPVAERPSSPVSTSFLRHLPRPDGLASYAICVRLPHLLTQTRNPPTNTTGQREFPRFGVFRP